MKTINPVVWFEIYVDDIQRAKKFYETVLDLELSEMPTPGSDNERMEMISFPMKMEDMGAGGALVKMEGIPPGGNATLIYFGSEDCAIEEKRIENAGGKVLQSKQSIGEHGAIVIGQDTEGNMFGIHSQA